jgi:hypothetical protein
VVGVDFLSVHVSTNCVCGVRVRGIYTAAHTGASVDTPVFFFFSSRLCRSNARKHKKNMFHVHPQTAATITTAAVLTWLYVLLALLPRTRAQATDYGLDYGGSGIAKSAGGAEGVRLVEKLTVQMQETLTNKSIQYWTQLAANMVDLGGRLTAIQGTMRALLVPSLANQTVFINCTVPPYVVLQTNQTAFEQLVCCHVIAQRRSTASRLLAALQAFYLPQPLPINTNALVTDVSDLRASDLMTTPQMVCMADQRIAIPDTQCIRAQSGATVIAHLQAGYVNIENQLSSLAGCVGQPLEATDCLANTTATVAPSVLTAPPLDPLLARVCSPAALAALYTAIINAFCG